MRRRLSDGERITLREHLEALRLADEKFHTERDRRYAEVKNAEEKALRVKEGADRTALQLAREIQTYKDEKANDLRAQIESERGTYATQNDLRGAVEKLSATIKPTTDWIITQQGRSSGITSSWGYLLGGLAAAAAIAGVVGFMSSHLK